MPWLLTIMAILDMFRWPDAPAEAMEEEDNKI